jgi:hypothetical protein
MDYDPGNISSEIVGGEMVKTLSSRWFWGLVLIIGGVLLLLDTFGIFKGGALLWTILSAIVGVLFLSVYITNHIHWWALIPGVIFLAIAALIGSTSFLPGFSTSSLPGTVILGGIGLSFLLVYLVEHKNWWAIIPAGVMGTLAVVAALDPVTTGDVSGGIFLLGLGLTFGLVAVLPNSIGQMRWAWIPAGILGIIGLLLLLAAGTYINYVWPAILILGGLLLIVRAIGRK